MRVGIEDGHQPRDGDICKLTGGERHDRNTYIPSRVETSSDPLPQASRLTDSVGRGAHVNQDGLRGSAGALPDRRLTFRAGVTQCRHLLCSVAGGIIQAFRVDPYDVISQTPNSESSKLRSRPPVLAPNNHA